MRLFFPLLLILLTVIVRPVGAQELPESFTNTISVHYAIAPDGNATVTYDITLTNLTSVNYPKGYHMSIDSKNISSIIAYDNGGQITPVVESLGNVTDIDLFFHDRTVGLGENMTFTVRYQTNDIARKIGSVWEIIIPKAPDIPNLKTYTVSLDAPSVFGPLVSLSPKPVEGYRWEKEQLIDTGITAVFGQAQQYRLQMHYTLTNTDNITHSHDISIPPDTLYQDVDIDYIRPLPNIVSPDTNGNWIGRYTLKPQERLTIEAVYFVKVSMTPRSSWAGDDPGTSKTFTSSNPFDQQALQAIASSVQSPEDIYTYLVGTFTYAPYNKNSEMPEKNGSLFQNSRSATSEDFTKAFLAISSASSIQARQIIGLAIPEDASKEPVGFRGTQFHTWPEYFDHSFNAWLPADPTWGQTTGRDYFSRLDFRHVALAIADSGTDALVEEPIHPSIPSDDVSIEILDHPPVIRAGNISGKLTFPTVALAGFPARGTVEIENTTALTLDKLHATVVSTVLPYTFSTDQENLTPYSIRKVDFTHPPAEYYRFGRGTLKLTVHNETKEFKFYVIPIVPLGIICLSLFFMIKVLPSLIRREKFIWKMRKKK